MTAPLFTEENAPFKHEDGRKCIICDAHGNESLCMLPCLHIFCVWCIRRWFLDKWEEDPKAVTCPECRADSLCQARCGHPVDLLKLPPVDVVDWSGFLHRVHRQKLACRYCKKNPPEALRARRGLTEMLKSYCSDYKPEDEELQEWDEWFKSDKARPVEVVEAKGCFIPRLSL